MISRNSAPESFPEDAQGKLCPGVPQHQGQPGIAQPQHRTVGAGKDAGLVHLALRPLRLDRDPLHRVDDDVSVGAVITDFHAYAVTGVEGERAE